MRGLKSLIRLHRFLLDERRRTLKDLEALGAQLTAALRRLEDELDAEMKAVEAAPELAFAFADYSAGARERRGTLIDSIGETERRIARARDAVNAAFQDLKKYEITQANRERLAAARAARVEQTNLDEIGLTMFRRQDRRPG